MNPEALIVSMARLTETMESISQLQACQYQKLSKRAVRPFLSQELLIGEQHVNDSFRGGSKPGEQKSCSKWRNSSCCSYALELA